MLEIWAEYWDIEVNRLRPTSAHDAKGVHISDLGRFLVHYFR